MKFTIRVRTTKTGREWDEEYDKPEVHDQASAEVKGRAIVQYFNDTLRPHEEPRECLYVTFGAGSAVARHSWVKTNLVTVMRRVRGSFDEYECSECHITGRKFTLDGDVIPDSRFKAKGYGACDTAKMLMRRRQERNSRPRKRQGVTD